MSQIPIDEFVTSASMIDTCVFTDNKGHGLLPMLTVHTELRGNPTVLSNALIQASPKDLLLADESSPVCLLSVKLGMVLWHQTKFQDQDQAPVV